MNRKELAAALLDTPIFVGGTSRPPDIYVMSERDGEPYLVKSLRYNQEKGRIELIVEP